MNNLAIYPGTFDPITNGHLNIIQKASKLFPKIIVAVANDTGKDPLFSLAERTSLCQKAIKKFPSVEVQSFSGLIVDFAKACGSNTLIRGFRAVSDFEYELQQSLTNKKLAPEIETIFFLPDFKNLYLSSSIVRQVLSLGGDLRDFVPKAVSTAIIKKMEKR